MNCSLTNISQAEGWRVKSGDHWATKEAVERSTGVGHRLLYFKSAFNARIWIFDNLMAFGNAEDG